MPQPGRKVALSWSSGKDSAWTLHQLRRTPGVEVVALITSFNGVFDRVAMHAVRRPLVEQQALQSGLPLWSIDLPHPCTNAEYEARLESVWARALEQDVEAIAFGDLFLADIRAYRERQLQGTGLTPLFPLWELPTAALAREMMAGGIRARITCVNPQHLNPACAGAEFDEQFLAALPDTVDPCGERGEFHTFVYDAPVFREPIAIESGETVVRDGFVFADLLPATV